MGSTVRKAIGASAIALAAVGAAGTPALAAVGGTGPAGGSSQSLGVLQGPGGGVSQGLHVTQPSNPMPACLVPGAPAGAGPACQNRTSETTRNAINSWNFGGAELGSAAANLLSSAVFGVPSLAIDLLQSLFHA